MWLRTLFWSIPSALLVSTSAAASQGAEEEVDFEREVAPIFAARCIKCHGPEKQKEGLRLDQRAAAFLGGDSGEPGVVPGDSASSELFRRIDPTDELDRMPPKGEPLTVDQIALIKRWIDEGAAWEAGDSEEIAGRSHWSFQPVGDPIPPGLPREEAERRVHAAINALDVPHP